MIFRVIDIFNRSAVVEVESELPYRDAEYEVLLNKEAVLRDNRNVVSLQGLLPETEYEIEVRRISSPERAAEDAAEQSCKAQPDEETETQRFTTRRESVLLDVRRFGARGDGVVNDTAAVQAAISCCPEEGTVYFPKGTYFLTPLFLKSQITLWLDEGAVLLGDPDRTHYPILPGMTQQTDEKGEYNLSSWEGNPLDSFASLITAMNVHDVDIIGAGTIDGGADAGDWWEDVRTRRIAWRPNTVFLAYSQRVRMQGVTVRNSPSWTIHPYYSDELRFLDLTIWNPSDSPNTDGFDPESCTDVLLLGTKISVGDDCVAIKSGKYYMSQFHFKRTRQVEIRNCLFERGHGSVTVGSEVAGGVEDVHVSQCIFDGTDRGVRLKTRRGRGQRSYLGGLIFEKIRMSGVYMPMTVNMFYYCDPDGHSSFVQDQSERPVDELTPTIGPLVIRDVDCTGASASIVCAYGLPEQPIERVELQNVTASFLPENERTPQVPIMMDDFPVMNGKSFYLHNIREVILENVTVEGAEDTEPELIGVENARISGLRYV